MSAVGAIILAAGASTRLGKPKQLLRFGDETLLRRTVCAASDAGCGPLLVVVRETEREIEFEMRGTNALIVTNPAATRGIGTSIRCGVQEARRANENLLALVILVCDQPCVSAETIRALISKWQEAARPIVASRYAGTLGVPALFDAGYFDALEKLPDDAGAKSLIESNIDQIAAIDFEGGAIDIDTAEDYRRLTSSI